MTKINKTELYRIGKRHIRIDGISLLVLDIAELLKWDALVAFIHYSDSK